jgi:hypothetical protein
LAHDCFCDPPNPLNSGPTGQEQRLLLNTVLDIANQNQLIVQAAELIVANRGPYPQPSLEQSIRAPSTPCQILFTQTLASVSALAKFSYLLSQILRGIKIPSFSTRSQYEIAVDLHAVAYGLEMTLSQSKAIQDDNNGTETWCEILDHVPEFFSKGYESLRGLQKELDPYVGSVDPEIVKNAVQRRADIKNIKQLLGYFVSKSCFQTLENFENLTSDPHPRHARHQPESSRSVPDQNQKEFVILTPKAKTLVRSVPWTQAAP